MGKKDLLQLGGVVIGGLFGGFGFWLLAIYSDTTVFASFGPVGKMASLMFLGSVAALIGVYLLTASDLTSVKTYVFALVCGLVWQPIITAGKQVVTNAAVKKDVAALNRSTEKLKSLASSGSKVEVARQIQTVSQGIVSLTKFSAGIQSSSQRDQISNSSTEALNAVSVASPKAPEAAIDALQTITVQASNTGSRGIAVAAVQNLRDVAVRTAIAGENADSTLATTKLGEIAAQVSDQVIGQMATQNKYVFGHSTTDREAINVHVGPDHGPLKE